MWKMTPGYKLWVFGGLAAIVVVLVAAGLANPTGEGLIFLALPLLAVYLGGIFYLQARMVDATEQELTVAPSGSSPAAAASAAGPPADWRDLMRELSVSEIDSAAQLGATRGMTGMARGQIRDGAILCALILVGVGLFYAGVGGVLRPFGEGGPGFPVVLLPVFVMIVYLVARIPFNMAAARETGDAYLEPLGLAITRIPDVGVRPRYGGSGMQTDVSGPTVMSGTRHGAPVEVSIEARESETRVGAQTPAFEVKGDDERLSVSEDAPDGVRAAIAEMATDARWKRVEVTGGADGVVVKRRFRGSQHTQWLWMADLWLAERLAAAARGG
jgi:hypothetical protein